MNVNEILKEAVFQNASDVFLIPGQPLSYKINGQIQPQNEQKLNPQQTYELISQLYQLAGREQFAHFLDTGDDDFALSIQNIGRFRVNAYRQRGSLSAVVRVVLFELPNPENLYIPEAVMDLANRTKGLVLVTGPAGSGKSTTLACLIDYINKNRNCHVLTLEDPIEFLYKHDKSIVSQREISLDTESYVRALKSALRQSPDVILIGEMRDLETIDIAMTAAETGHLVLSSLHTVGSANTIDRIIDVFPASQQQQIRIQLSMVLQAVVSQQLLPSEKVGRVPAFEVMLANTAIKNLIRESKLHQIDSVIFSNGASGMQTLDSSILSLYKKGLIQKETAIAYATSPENMAKQVNLIS